MTSGFEITQGDDNSAVILHVRSVIIEIRRDLYLNEATGEPIQSALHGLSAAVAICCEVQD